MADPSNRIIICVEDNYRDQKVVRKTGLARNPPGFLASILRPGPCDEVWFLPRASDSLTMQPRLLNPSGCRRLDAGISLAVEMALPIGPGEVSVDEAQRAIGWARIALDVVRRDVPAEQAFLARSYPTHTPVSEHRVRWSDLPTAADCTLQLAVNGHIRQRSRLESQRASAATLITQIARSVRFSPGDLLLTGTPHGIAFDGGEQWLQVGDQIVASIEGLGQLTVHVEHEPPR